MKQLSLIAAAATLALTGLAHSPEASATIVCTACSYNQATNGNLYVGALNSTGGDLSFVNSGNQANSVGAFSHVYVFNFSPLGSVASNLTFLPTSEISNFKLELFNAAGTLGCSPLAAGGVGTGGCSTLSAFNAGNLLATAVTNPNFLVNLDFFAVPAGIYAVRVTGTVAAGGPNSGYSGQITTSPVPEPVSLALVGIALVGAGLASRSRKA